MWTLRVNWMWGGVMWTVQVAEGDTGKFAGKFFPVDGMLRIRRRLAIDEALHRLREQKRSQP